MTSKSEGCLSVGEWAKFYGISERSVRRLLATSASFRERHVDGKIEAGAWVSALPDAPEAMALAIVTAELGGVVERISALVNTRTGISLYDAWVRFGELNELLELARAILGHRAYCRRSEASEPEASPFDPRREEWELTHPTLDEATRAALRAEARLAELRARDPDIVPLPDGEMAGKNTGG